MGSKSKSQTVGYSYFGSLIVVIGNRIETMLGIRPDNTKWIEIIDPELPQNIDYQNCVINEPNLFGGDNKEGGWEGYVDLQCGHPEPLQNEHLKNQLGDIISSYPYLSYLVYHGKNNKGFKLVSMSGILKEVLYWPKRTRVRNDGREQWYLHHAEPNGSVLIVPEIGARIDAPTIPEEVEYYDGPPMGWVNSHWIYTQGCDLSMSEPAVTHQDRSWYRVQNTVPHNPLSLPYPKGQVLDGPSGSGPSAGCVSTTAIDGYYDWPPLYGRRYGRARIIMTNGTISDSVIYSFNIHVPENCVVGDHLSWQWWSDPSFVIFETTRTAPTTVTFKIIVPYFYTLDIEFFCKSTDHPNRPNDANWYLYNYAFDAWYVLQAQGIKTPASEVKGIDINPIHKMREILTDDTAMGYAESEINDQNFRDAALRIYKEGLGISWALTEKSCKEALDELCYHIEAGLRVNRQTGKYEVILFRDDLWNLDDAIIFNESNIKSFVCEIVNSDEIINSSNISFYDRDNIKSSSFSLENNGLLKSVNKQNSNKLDFPYFMKMENAEKVGNWKLKQLSTPLRKGSFTTGIKQARKLNRYDTFLLSWSNQKLVNLPCRIMKIILGDGIDNTVTIHWVELVKFSSLYYPPINTDQSLSPEGQSPASVLASVYELTYYEAVMQQGQVNTDNNLTEFPEVGFLCAVAKRGQNNSLNAELHTRLSTASEYTMANLLDYTECSLLQSSINKTDNEIHIINAKDMPVDSLLKLGNEILSLLSTDVDNNVITVQRGCLDTIPQDHAMGSVVWYIDEFNAVDPISYVFGDVVNAKVLTTTPSDKLRLVDAPTLSLDIQARPIRPYPPANVKINDEYWPAEISDGVNLSWNHRNRVQQTGGTFISWFDGSVTPESGISYTVELYDDNNVLVSSNDVGLVDSYVLDISTVETEHFIVKLYSVRDGFESYQSFEHRAKNLDFLSEPYNVQGIWNAITNSIDLTWEHDV